MRTPSASSVLSGVMAVGLSCTKVRIGRSPFALPDVAHVRGERPLLWFSFCGAGEGSRVLGAL